MPYAEAGTPKIFAHLLLRTVLHPSMLQAISEWRIAFVVK